MRLRWAAPSDTLRHNHRVFLHSSDSVRVNTNTNADNTSSSHASMSSSSVPLCSSLQIQYHLIYQLSMPQSRPNCSIFRNKCCVLHRKNCHLWGNGNWDAGVAVMSSVTSRVTVSAPDWSRLGHVTSPRPLIGPHVSHCPGHCLLVFGPLLIPHQLPLPSSDGGDTAGTQQPALLRALVSSHNSCSNRASNNLRLVSSMWNHS